MVKHKSKEAKRQYSVMLKPSLVNEIDQIADKYNQTRSQLIGRFIMIGVERIKSEKIIIQNDNNSYNHNLHGVFGNK